VCAYILFKPGEVVLVVSGVAGRPRVGRFCPCRC